MKRAVPYDLHIHSCLSPCGDADMTVNNIVNMALIKQLQLIALTDHNSCKNCPAFLKVAQQAGIAALPGMELTTEEEIHLVCLFPALENAMEFDRMVHARLMDIKNRPEIFGEQLILDEMDEVTGREETLLVGASSIGISEAPGLVRAYGGLCFPAHIDRQSYSVLSNLGQIPPECGFCTVEVHDPLTFFADGANAQIRAGYHILTNSDAHYLQDIAEPEQFLHLEQLDFSGLAGALL